MFDEIKIKPAKNGFIVEIDGETHIARSPYLLTEVVRALIDADFIPDNKRERKPKTKKKKL